MSVSGGSRDLLPRDVVKLAFQFQEYDEIPFCFNASPDQQAGLTAHYGGEYWRDMVRPYIGRLTDLDAYLSLAGSTALPGGLEKDPFGCVWRRGSTMHLVQAPLVEPNLEGFRLPDVSRYITDYLKPCWHRQREIQCTQSSLRVVTLQFGLFERAWSLRGFENFCMDLFQEPHFCEELLGHICEWMLEALDGLLSAPLDGVILTDDYADQRGMIFGLDRFRRFFKPHWKRIFARIRKAGVYSILHVCGNAAPAVPDLIDCGLDCLESLQPEAMDIYKLKREFGRDIRLWGGLGAQSTLLASPEEVRREVRHLKKEMAQGGGYILAGAKGILEDVPVANVIAYLEEAAGVGHL